MARCNMIRRNARWIHHATHRQTTARPPRHVAPCSQRAPAPHLPLVDGDPIAARMEMSISACRDATCCDAPHGRTPTRPHSLFEPRLTRSPPCCRPIPHERTIHRLGMVLRRAARRAPASLGGFLVLDRGARRGRRRSRRRLADPNICASAGRGGVACKIQ